MNDTVILALTAGLMSGGTLVWGFMTQIYSEKKKKVDELEERLNIQAEVISYQSQVITRIVAAIEYTDTLQNEHALKKEISALNVQLNQKIEEIKSRKTKTTQTPSTSL